MSKRKKTCVIVAIIAALAASVSAVCLFLKRRRYRAFYMLTAAVLICGFMFGGAMTVYAAEQEADPPDTIITEYDTEQGESEVIESITEVTETITGDDLELDIGNFIDPEYQPNLLTPPGNLTLIDDFAGEQADIMQFITVQTRNGHFFYIIIDRVGERENVHFLNQVDEFSLLQILQGEDGEMPALPPGMVTITPQEPTEDEPDETNDDTPTQPRQNNNLQILLMLAMVGLIGGGAFYYFKVWKPKQGGGTAKAATPVIDEFDFDPDEDDLFSDNADSYEPSGAEYDNDHDGDIGEDGDDMPDFTLTPDSNEFSFEAADFDAETQESEDK